MRRIILALTIALFAASFVAADTVCLRDGRTVRGTVLGFINGRFVVRVDGQDAPNTGPASRTEPSEGDPRCSSTSVPMKLSASRSKDALWTRCVLRTAPCRYRWSLTGSTRASTCAATRRYKSLPRAPSWPDARITPAGLRSRRSNSPLPQAARERTDRNHR